MDEQKIDAEASNIPRQNLYDAKRVGFFGRLGDLQRSFPDVSGFDTITAVREAYSHPCGYMVLAFLFGTAEVNYATIEKPIREDAFLKLLTQLSEKTGVSMKHLSETSSGENLEERLNSDNFLGLMVIEPTTTTHEGEEIDHASLVVKDERGVFNHVQSVSLQNMGGGDSARGAFWSINHQEIELSDVFSLVQRAKTRGYVFFNES